MNNREKIVKDLLDFVADLSPFAGNHFDWMKVHAAIKYLKDPVEPVFVGNDEWQCPECEVVVGWTELECGGITETKYKYCPKCGRMIAWE